MMRGLVTDGNSAEMKKKKKNGTEPKEDRFENWSDKGRVSSVVGQRIDWFTVQSCLKLRFGWWKCESMNCDGVWKGGIEIDCIT